MAGNLAPVLRQRHLDANGNPLAGGKLYSYQAGTSTLQATYTDSSLATPNANPVVLDANGYAAVWLDPELSYKFVLKDENDVVQFTEDNIIGLLSNDAVATASLQDGAVTEPKIANGAVSGDKLKSSGSIDADRPVGTNNIKDLAITRAKVAAQNLTELAGHAQMNNMSLAASVAANAMTVALKSKAGTDPSSSDTVRMAFRSATATSGVYVERTISAALSVVIPSSATLGHKSGEDEYVYVYAIDNAGTVELAVCSSRHKDQGALYSTTAISAAATNPYTLYSTAARTGVAIRLLGRIKVNQAAAGTWASSPSEISLLLNEPLSAALDYVVRYARIGWSAGTPVVLEQSKPTWIDTSSLTDNGSGDVTLGLVSGAFSSAPVPMATGDIDSGAHFDVFISGSPSTSSLRLKIGRTTTEGGTDLGKIYLACAGKP